ncbi:MAG: MATE family efflux transporter, partial [Candidatus Thermoplasmatota archaeon]|nr:MATE family efflux transporter [Candidatus Thermoplasmatota archaeon]
SAPLFAVMSVATSAFIAMGDSRTPLWVNGSMNFVNVLFNYVLIFGEFGFPRMEVRGAAWGTFISFVWAAVLYMILLAKRDGHFAITFSSMKPKKDLIMRILRIGIPAAGEQLVMQVGFLIYMIIVVRFGVEALAAHSIGMRIQSLAFMPSMGFATAATALTGQYLGSKDPDTAEKAGLLATKFCLIVMLSIGAVMFLMSEEMAWLFIDEKAVVDLAGVFIMILAVGSPAIAIHFTLAGALRGAGDTKYPFYATGIGFFAVRLPLAIILGFFTPLGIYGVWLAMISEYNVRSSVILYRFTSGKWKTTTV